MNSMGHEFTNNGNGFEKITAGASSEETRTGTTLHPSWRSFVRYCAELRHGEIERLKIQDGLPVMAEVIKEKIKFNS
jgi:hypothetical protein